METVCEALDGLVIEEANIVQRKDEIRQGVWDYMEQNDLIEDYPRPCHQKIPHFKVKMSVHSFNAKTLFILFLGM